MNEQAIASTLAKREVKRSLVLVARVVFAFIGALLGYSGSLVLLDAGVLNGVVESGYLVGLLVFSGVLIDASWNHQW